MMKRALFVGIDKYNWSELSGCDLSALKLGRVLERNYDASPNFHSNYLVSSQTTVTKSQLIKQVDRLGNWEGELALFYFAGYGSTKHGSSFLVTQDASKYDEGVDLNQILSIANQSRVKNFIIILDCWASGAFGNFHETYNSSFSNLRKGVSIIANTGMEEAGEILDITPNYFTELIIDGLNGNASNLVGHVSLTSLYSFLESFLRPLGHRPWLKANVSELVSLRQCEPKISWSLLRKLTNYFDSTETKIQLDPSFEPTSNEPLESNVRKYVDFQKFNSVGLIRPNNEEHLYFAAMNSKVIELTSTGKVYWNLLRKSLI